MTLKAVGRAAAEDAVKPEEQAGNEREPETVAAGPIDVRSAALTVLAVLATILVLQYAQAMIIPVVLGILISYALEPIVARLTKWRLPRPISAAVVLIAVTAAAGLLIYGLRSQASAIVEQLPVAARRLREIVENEKPTTAVAIQQVQKAATELEKAASAAAPPPASGVPRVQVEAAPFSVTDYLMWGSIGVAAAVGQLVLILFLAYFLLASGDLYRRKLVKIVGPSLSKKKVTVQILSEIDRQIEMFLLVQVFTSTVVAIATWLAFRALGVNKASAATWSRLGTRAATKSWTACGSSGSLSSRRWKSSTAASSMASTRRRCGAFSPASSTRFRISARCWSPAAPRWSRSCSSARSTWRCSFQPCRW